MKTYTIHEAPDAPADRLQRAEELVFVADGFAWAAALLTPFWLLAHRLWLEFLAYAAIATIAQLLLTYIGVTENAIGTVMLAVNLLVGFEASSIRRWNLRRRGFVQVGTVSGRSTEECERRFFEIWLKEQPIIASGALQTGSSVRGGQGRLGDLAMRGRGT